MTNNILLILNNIVKIKINKYSTTGVPNSTLGKDLKGLLYTL